MYACQSSVSPWQLKGNCESLSPVVPVLERRYHGPDPWTTIAMEAACGQIINLLFPTCRLIDVVAVRLQDLEPRGEPDLPWFLFLPVCLCQNFTSIWSFSCFHVSSSSSLWLLFLFFSLSSFFFFAFSAIRLFYSMYSFVPTCSVKLRWPRVVSLTLEVDYRVLSARGKRGRETTLRALSSGCALVVAVSKLTLSWWLVDSATRSPSVSTGEMATLREYKATVIPDIESGGFDRS
ncbi:hypothetical protein BDW42DRAFT_6627 [Aspergillus taichungensis]|uniref:Uncharacterized protein n=1 Tax=Aspergillus taichungensis TaxID=482145 RepID=A0A2J5HJR0_9EURO|nr:hypothetical protein BDW42DRAFT_6627 [Aspergillus taichungensis]